MATLTSQLILSLVDRVTAPVRAVEKSISSLQQKIAKNNQRLSELRGQMVEAAAVGYGLYKALQAPTMAAVAFESSLADLQKVSNLEGDSLTAFGKELRTLAVTEIPMAVTELAALATAAAQNGVDEADLMPYTRMVAKAAVAWEMGGQEAGLALAKIKTQLALTQPELKKYADAINYVSDNTASTPRDLIEFTKQVAAQGEFFGIAKEQTLAWGAAMISAGAAPEVAATSFRNMGRALTSGASASTRRRDAFTRLGLNAHKVAKGMQEDSGKTIIDVMERIAKLPDEIKPSLMSDLFGDEARALTPLLKRIDVLKKALGLVEPSLYVGSVEEEFKKRSKTTENALQLAKNQINELALVIGNALLPPLNDALKAMGPFVLSIARFAEANPKLVRGIVGITSALIGLRVAAIAAQWSFAWMKGAVLMSAIGGLRALRAAMWAVQFAMLPFGAALRSAGSAMIAFAAVSRIVGTGGALKIIGASALAALNPLRLLAGAVRLAGIALKVAFISTGVGAIIAGIAAAGIWIYNNWSGIGELFSAFGRSFMAALGPAAPLVQKFWDGVKGIWDAVSGMLGPIDESGASWRAWGETLGAVAAGGVQKLLSALNTVIGALQSAYQWASDAAGAVAGFFGVGGGNPAPVATGTAAKVEPRATGGPVSALRPYLVGERGPELFVPRAHGAIVNARNTAQALQSRGAASLSNANRAMSNARTPAVGSGGGQSGNSGPASITFGDINIQGGANATPQQIRREFSREASAIMRRHFSDGIT